MIILAVVQHGHVNFSAVNIDKTGIYIFAGIILVAICAIWGIRKMIVLGYISSVSSVPVKWQEKYDKEKDLADYKKFRDEGGFQDGRFGFSFGDRAYRFNGFGSDSEDDSEDDSIGELIGSVDGKSWYYDKDGMVYSNYDEDGDPYVDYYGNLYSGSGELVKGIFVFDSYESRESYRDQLMDYIDYKQEFASDDEYIAWRNQENDSIDFAQYYGDDGEIRVGHPVDEDEDLNIGWEK